MAMRVNSIVTTSLMVKERPLMRTMRLSELGSTAKNMGFVS